MSLVQDVFDALASRKIMLATAESCTGGMIAAAITDIAGSSTIFDRGFVTYSNEAKIAMLGVSMETLDRYGAVSEQTALEMASGALEHSDAGIAVSVTGIAGPGGGSAEKPVGLVWFGIAGLGLPPAAQMRRFDGDRDAIRAAAVRTALELVHARLDAVDQSASR